MIFGKSDIDKRKEYAEWVKIMYKRRERVFAWLPVRLYNDQYAWMQWVYKDYNISYDDYHNISLSQANYITYYLEDKINAKKD